jgi:hypothetical protein
MGDLSFDPELCRQLFLSFQSSFAPHKHFNVHEMNLLKPIPTHSCTSPQCGALFFVSGPKSGIDLLTSILYSSCDTSQRVRHAPSRQPYGGPRYGRVGSHHLVTFS